MDIKVLGTGCTNCKNTIALIDQVAKDKGVSIQLEKVEELRDIKGDGEWTADCGGPYRQ